MYDGLMIATSLTIDKLWEVGADFGGLRQYAHPNMLKFVSSYSYESKRYTLNLEKTLQKFNDLVHKLTEINASGKKILFVATGSKIRNVIGKFISQTEHFYVDNKWLGGMLTNFNFIQKRLFLLQELYSQEHKGLVDHLSKKERLKFQIHKKTLEINLKGILQMKSLPDYLFIVGPEVQKIALKEAQKLNIPVLAMLKTNGDPKMFEEFLPINDGSASVLELIMNEIVKICFPKKDLQVQNEEKNIASPATDSH